MPTANVLVTFYDNFHFNDVDVSGVFPGIFNNGTEERTGEFLYSPEFESKIEHKPIIARYTSIKVRVVASGGTWMFKLHLSGEDYECGPFSATATAAEIQAGLPVFIQDPGEPVFEQATAGPFPSFAGFSDFLEVLDLGVGEWELRIFEDSGVIFPSGASLLTINVDLGAVIEKQPDWDQTVYGVELKEGDPFKAIDVPPSSIEPGGASSGRLADPGSG
jgi:hypothetical protein